MFGPLTLRSEWHVTSPYNIHTLSIKQLTRLLKLILIQYQIFVTNLKGNLLQLVGRINNQILRVKVTVSLLHQLQSKCVDHQYSDMSAIVWLEISLIFINLICDCTYCVCDCQGVCYGADSTKWWHIIVKLLQLPLQTVPSLCFWRCYIKV